MSIAHLFLQHASCTILWWNVWNIYKAHWYDTNVREWWEGKSKSLAGWWIHAGQRCSVFFSLKYLHSDSWRIFKKTSFNFLYAECSAEIVMLTLVRSEVGLIGRKRDRRAGAKSWSHKARWDAIRRIQRRVISQIREYRGDWLRRSENTEGNDVGGIGHKSTERICKLAALSLSLLEENWPLCRNIEVRWRAIH